MFNTQRSENHYMAYRVFWLTVISNNETILLSIGPENTCFIQPIIYYIRMPPYTLIIIKDYRISSYNGPSEQLWLRNNTMVRRRWKYQWSLLIWLEEKKPPWSQIWWLIYVSECEYVYRSTAIEKLPGPGFRYLLLDTYHLEVYISASHRKYPHRKHRKRSISGRFLDF